jgi:N-acetylneuraminate synthase
MEFTPEQWAGLAEHAKQAGLIFLSSAFSLEAFELLERIGVPAWKVASGELTNKLLLDAMVASGKPLLLSSGMSDIGSLETITAELRSSNVPFGVFQCTTKYPTPLEQVGLNLLPVFRDRLACPVGLSDHSGSPFPALAAMAQGAAMIEVHLTFHRRQFGPDTIASLTPDDFALLARARDAFHTMANHPVDKDAMAQSLAGMSRLFGKSVALKRAQVKGTVLTRDMLTTKKPGTGLAPEKMDSLIGRTLARDISASELLAESDLV